MARFIRCGGDGIDRIIDHIRQKVVVVVCLQEQIAGKGNVIFRSLFRVGFRLDEIGFSAFKQEVEKSAPLLSGIGIDRDAFDLPELVAGQPVDGQFQSGSDFADLKRIAAGGLDLQRAHILFVIGADPVGQDFSSGFIRKPEQAFDRNLRLIVRQGRGVLGLIQHLSPVVVVAGDVPGFDVDFDVVIVQPRQLRVAGDEFVPGHHQIVESSRDRIERERLGQRGCDAGVDQILQRVIDADAEAGQQRIVAGHRHADLHTARECGVEFVIVVVVFAVEISGAECFAVGKVELAGVVEGFMLPEENLVELPDCGETAQIGSGNHVIFKIEPSVVVNRHAGSGEAVDRVAPVVASAPVIAVGVAVIEVGIALGVGLISPAGDRVSKARVRIDRVGDAVARIKVVGQQIEQRVGFGADVDHGDVIRSVELREEVAALRRDGDGAGKPGAVQEPAQPVAFQPALVFPEIDVIFKCFIFIGECVRGIGRPAAPGQDIGTGGAPAVERILGVVELFGIRVIITGYIVRLGGGGRTVKFRQIIVSPQFGGHGDGEVGGFVIRNPERPCFTPRARLSLRINRAHLKFVVAVCKFLDKSPLLFHRDGFGIGKSCPRNRIPDFIGDRRVGSHLRPVNVDGLSDIDVDGRIGDLLRKRHIPGGDRTNLQYKLVGVVQRQSIKFAVQRERTVLLQVQYGVWRGVGVGMAGDGAGEVCRISGQPVFPRLHAGCGDRDGKRGSLQQRDVVDDHAGEFFRIDRKFPVGQREVDHAAGGIDGSGGDQRTGDLRSAVQYGSCRKPQDAAFVDRAVVEHGAGLGVHGAAVVHFQIIGNGPGGEVERAVDLADVDARTGFGVLHAAGLDGHIAGFAAGTDVLDRFVLHEAAEGDLPLADILLGFDPVIHRGVGRGFDDDAIFGGAVNGGAEVVADIGGRCGGEAGGGAAGFDDQLAPPSRFGIQGSLTVAYRKDFFIENMVIFRNISLDLHSRGNAAEIGGGAVEAPAEDGSFGYGGAVDGAAVFQAQHRTGIGGDAGCGAAVDPQQGPGVQHGVGNRAARMYFDRASVRLNPAGFAGDDQLRPLQIRGTVMDDMRICGDGSGSHVQGAAGQDGGVFGGIARLQVKLFHPHQNCIGIDGHEVSSSLSVNLRMSI